MLQLRSDLPEFWEQDNIQGATQVRHASRAARTGFKTDHAFDGGQVIKTPTSEIVLDINQFFGERVQIPVLFGVAVDLEPGEHDGFVGLMRNREISGQQFAWNA